MANNTEPPRPYYIKPKPLILRLLEANKKNVKPLQPGELMKKQKIEQKTLDNG